MIDRPVVRRRRALTTRLASLAFLAVTSFGCGPASAQVPDPLPDPVPSARDVGVRSGVLWEPFLAWSVPLGEVPGNPFDVLATATFTHAASGERIVTQAFFAGEDTWSWRFTPTRAGSWHFALTSELEGLDGWHGEVDVAPNPDPTARGFLLASGNRFAQQVGQDGELVARLYNVYMDTLNGNELQEFSLDPVKRARTIERVLDAVEAHGFDAAFLSVAHGWFEHGALSYRDHDSENPSLASFEVIESLILRAHERGLHVHLWMWGDESRRRTPIGVGGINGEIDQRLQRYIAARLGPLPGWTLSYAFDLEEWVTPEQVREWWTYLQAHLGWPHLLMARESDARAPDLVFDLGNRKLNVASNDEQPNDGFYLNAREQLAATNLPVLYERRFLHTRDGVWDMTTTRRALWQFTLAGGAGSIWGPLWDGPAYPAPEQLRTHQAFWRERFTLDLDRADQTNQGYRLRNTDGTHAVLYIENSDRIELDLRSMNGPARVIAVDTTRTYTEIDLGTLNNERHTWTAPRKSDWAIAITTN